MLTIEDITVQVINEFVKPNFNTNPSVVALNYHAEEENRYYSCSAHLLIEDFDEVTDGIEPHFFDEEFCEYLKKHGISDYGSFHYYEFDQYGLEVLFYIIFETVREFMSLEKLKNKNPEKLYQMSKHLAV
jgi:hypothetical protein